jgi:hypothetical protein
MSDWMGSLELCLEALVFAAAAIAVYEGSRRLLQGGFGRLRLLLLVVGLVPLVGEGVMSLRFATAVHVMLGTEAAMQAKEPPGGWEKQSIPPEERTRKSLEGARINYALSGRPGTYVDASGQRVPFVPSAEELQRREDLVRARQSALDNGAQFDERGALLLAFACGLMLCGAVVGGLQRARARRTPA